MEIQKKIKLIYLHYQPDDYLNEEDTGTIEHQALYEIKSNRTSNFKKNIIDPCFQEFISALLTHEVSFIFYHHLFYR